MSTLNELIHLARYDSQKIIQAIDQQVDDQRHSAELINNLLYALLASGEWECARSLADLLSLKGYDAHGILLAPILAATVLADIEVQSEWVEAVKSMYSFTWPEPRKRLIKSLKPLVAKIQKDELAGYPVRATRLQWLINIMYPDFHYGDYQAPTFSALTGRYGLKTRIVDIGAADIGWPPPYQVMLQDGATLIGFEPSEEAYRRLVASAKPNQSYLKVAVGDGTSKTLNFFRDPGMTSCLLPNEAVLKMFFPYDCRVTESEEIDTQRLDDVAEIGDVDLLKMDVQGLELEVLRNATSKLKRTLVIDIEVSFVRLYQGQPLFSDIDQFLQQYGFQLHRFNYDADPKLEGTGIQTVGPGWTASGTGLVSHNRGQVLWADAVYVRDLSRLEELSDKQLLSMARVLHDGYQSYALVQHLLTQYDERLKGSLTGKYVTGRLLH